MLYIVCECVLEVRRQYSASEHVLCSPPFLFCLSGLIYCPEIELWKFSGLYLAVCVFYLWYVVASLLADSVEPSQAEQRLGPGQDASYTQSISNTSQPK